MILAKDIIQDPNPVLRKQSHKVTGPLNKDERHLAKELMKYLVVGQTPGLGKKYGIMGGVGIAAPQVGVNKMIIAVLVPNKRAENAKKPLFKSILINPVITARSKQKCALISGEGCLSVDKDIPGLVHRNYQIDLRYQDLNRTTHQKRLNGYPAIVCQHEIDHLHGTLFYDHINVKNRYVKQGPDEVLIDFSTNTDKEFKSGGSKDQAHTYRSIRIKSYKRNEHLTKMNVLRANQ